MVRERERERYEYLSYCDINYEVGSGRIPIVDFCAVIARAVVVGWTKGNLAP